MKRSFEELQKQWLRMNKLAQRLVVFYSTCPPSLVNLYGKRNLTAFFILKVSCVQIPCNESWLKWVRNSRLVTLFAPFPRAPFLTLLKNKQLFSTPASWVNAPFPSGSFLGRVPCWTRASGKVSRGPTCGFSPAWLSNPCAWNYISALTWQCMSQCSLFTFLI